MDVDVDFQMNSSFADYENYNEVKCLPAHEGLFIQALVYMALVLGLPGNGLIFALLWQKRRSWSATDTFVFFLSGSDVGLLITLPFWAVNAINGWTFGTGFCKTVAAIFKMTIYSEMILLACISAHHLLLVTGTYRLFSRQKLWLPFAVCLAACVASFLLSIGDWLHLKSASDHAYLYLGRDWCPVPISRWRGGGAIFVAVTIILLLGYIVTLVRLPPAKPQDHTKRKALKFILILAAAFFLSFLPYNIALLVDPVGTGADDCPDGHRTAKEMALMATATVGCLQSFIKPLLYLCLLSVFRTRALDLVRCQSNTQSNHKISMWDSGGEEEEEDDSATKGSLSQYKC